MSTAALPISDAPARWRTWVEPIVRWVVAIGGALVIFAAFMMVKGANPIEAYQSMWESLTTDNSLTGILVKSSPLILAALAVTVPARAGLVNVGGEGQLIMGGVFATWVSINLGGTLPGGVTLVLHGRRRRRSAARCGPASPVRCGSGSASTKRSPRCCSTTSPSTSCSSSSTTRGRTSAPAASRRRRPSPSPSGCRCSAAARCTPAS